MILRSKMLHPPYRWGFLAAAAGSRRQRQGRGGSGGSGGVFSFWGVCRG